MTTRLEDLRAMRELLWESVEKADPDKRAPLFARLESVIASIELVEAKTPKAGDPVDEIAARRSARGAGSAKSERQAGSDQG